MSTPSISSPALKSIQFCLLLYRLVFVDIFIVGMNVPNGVPRPVVNNTIWHPDAASAVDATRSLPGADSRFRPFVSRRSPYPRTPLTGARPHFCVHPKALSSSVDMPPALFPGDGFSPTGSPWLKKYSLKSFTNLTVCLNNCGVSHLFINIVSAPNISGTSVSIEVPPCATIKSDSSPTNGLAVIPLKPSLPPHLRPTRSSLNGHAVLLSSFAMLYRERNILIPSSISSPLTFCTTSSLILSLS